MSDEEPMTDRRTSQSGIQLDRRDFLRVSALAAGGAAASNLIGTPSFARVLNTDSPVASTKFGKVRGYIDNGINVFKGIRYGADTAARRFMPPAPPEPWTDVREGLSY